MRLSALIAGAILLSGISAPAFALERPPADEVDVTFKEPVGDRFVGVIHLVMGTATLKKLSPTRYAFHIGPRGNQNDYAVFFAYLPYVQAVSPLPQLAAAEREAPNVVLAPGAPNGRAAQAPAGRSAQAARGYVPGQLLIKPKASAPAQALSRFTQDQGASVKETLEGIDVQVLQLPSGLSVEEAQRRYQASGLVQFAEPNRTYSLNTLNAPGGPAGSTAVPADNGGPGVYLSPNQLVGEHVLVQYRAGGPVPELINHVYGTRTLEEAGMDQARLSLPPRLSPLVAQRILRLCPYVLQAEPAYGR